ncbi:GGDEF domain-containing response regulator [Pseudogemmobacter sonorensis]|uniref:GGDEF domain-containing response regulator n=1 Tax=Pseudogemmobacter sonorensis TaxID=2989681 RepID=UPI0036AD77EE
MSTAATATPTILIVDDDRLTRGLLADLLGLDCRILMARDGPSALQLMEREDIHLVLLDVSMAGMSGYEVLSRMKMIERLAYTPVIFITSLSEEVDEERGLALGAADYVQKPIHPAIVRARVFAHLRLEMQRRLLADLAANDGLTGLANRRTFDTALDRALRRATRRSEALAVGLFDIDHFKLFNDHYGHGAGDQTLRRVAAILGGHARRAGDLVARYGGEEFVLLTEDWRDLAPVMEEARRAVEAADLPHAASPTSGRVTLSGGGAALVAVPGLEAAELLARADAMLYRAKAEGRNRVLVEIPPGLAAAPPSG